MFHLGRNLDPEGKTAQIVIHPKNDEEGELFRKFKGVLLKDNQSIREFFLPSIQSKVVADNPQLHFEPVQGGLVLNKKVETKEKPPTLCPDCNGDGQNTFGDSCRNCGGYGKFWEDKARV